MALTSQQQQDIIKYAVGIYGASAGGYFAELGSYVAGGMTATQLAKALAGSNSFKNLSFAYSDASTNDQFATAFLNNLLGSSVTASTMALAKTWFLNQITANGRAQAVVNAIDAVFSASATDPDLGNAQKQLVNKIDVATDYTINQNGTSTDLNKLQQTIATVTQDPATATAAKTTNAAGTGQTYALTTGVDTLIGTAGNDVFNATDATLNALDSLTGGAGTDTLTLLDTAAGGTDFTAVNYSLSGIETINLRSGGTTVKFNSTAATGATNLNVTQAVNAVLTAATTTAVSVSGATGTIDIDGGSDITVTDATAAKNITIGATTVGSGNVTVTDTNVGTADVKVDGGKNVTLTLTGADATGGKVITVGNGGAATDLPSGVVSVTSTQKAVAATDVTLNAITVKGGSTITVTQAADTSKAATDTTGSTLTQGAVTIVGGNGTTSVTVSQAKSTTKVAAVTAVAGATETASVKFGVLKAGDKLTLDADRSGTAGATELTVTAVVDMTAAEVAAAFANLIKGTATYNTIMPGSGDSQSSAAASKGTYTGYSTLWTSAAANGDTVVFTSTTSNSNVGDLQFVLTNTSGTSAAPTVTTTAGSGATSAKTGVLGVINGVVTIDDNATASAAAITTVSVDGYGNGSTIGNTNTLSKLQTLSLANSGGTTAGATNGTMTVDAAGVASLNLTVNNIKGNVSLDGAADSALKTLSVTASGADSKFALTAAAVETLKVDGSKALDLSSSTLSALKTVTVSGSAGLTADVSGIASVTDVNASATSGANTITIKATQTTYEGGSGVDTVTTTNAGISKAISLGDGDDVFTVGTGVTSATANVSGGNGTDTIVMAMADAITATATNTFQNYIDGFEKLQVNAAGGGAAGAVDVANLDNINYVINNQIATVAGVKEVFKVTLTGAPIDTDTFIFDGVTFTYSDGTPTLAEFITGIAGTAFTNWDVTASDATSVTFTAKVAGAKTDAVSGDFTGTYAGTKAIAVSTQGVTAVTASGLLTVNNLASNGTIELAAGGAGATVAVKDAATGTADVLNVVTKVSTADLDHGTVTAANVETINLTVTDTSTSTINKSTLTLTADKATSLTINGNAALDLTLTGSTKLTTIDGSNMSGALKVTSLNTTSATTIKGGAGNDILIAATGTTADVLIGGAGDDTLYANAGLDTLTGGAGNDLFVIGTASLNSSSYATITDFAAGDLIKMTGVTSFTTAKVTQADTAVFQDYCNAAINTLAGNGAGWFQYGGNTYIVADMGGGTSFLNSTDFIVKLTGLVDLTNASFNSTYSTIAL